MLKQYSKIVKLLIAIAVVFGISTNTYAAASKCTSGTVASKFGANADVTDVKNGVIKLSITKGKFSVKIQVTDMSSASDDSAKEDTVVLDASSNVKEITYNVNEKWPNLANKPKRVRFEFTLTDANDANCTIDSDTVIRTITIPSKTTTTQVKNTNYDGLCANLRNGIWTDELGKGIKDLFLKYNPRATNSEAKYREYAPYCYSEYVTSNHSKDTVKMIISNALKAYKNSLKTTINIKEPDAKIPPENRFDLSSKSSDINRFNKGQSLTCNATKLRNSNDKEYSYVNKNTYYATDTKRTSTNLPNSKRSISCKKVCSETLTVEYGPPVASKAGLCFEYKVKVTSKVECDSVVEGTPPTPSEYPVCEPVPICNELDGKEHQAGPNSDFDSCINKCDNGQYTQNCINKCYKQVYGNNSKTTQTTATTTVPSLKLAYEPYEKISSTCDYTTNGGSYSCDKKTGVITWKAGSGCAAYAPYYFKYEGERTMQDNNSGKYVPLNGFKWNRQGCSDSCEFTGCSCSDSFSEDDAEEKYQEDLEAYEDFVNSCNAQASCSTKTAEFTIKVNNKTKDNPNKDNWITYDKATLTGNILNDSSEIIIDRSGCYGETKVEREYLTEWSFPGTWINNKTGEIKYQPIKDSAWHKKKDYFCTNLNSANVNTDWWYYGLTGDKKYLPTDEVIKNIEYNIQATAKNFGHYSWNLDVSCFYALYESANAPDCDCNNPECYEKNTEICKNSKSEKTLSYRIRTVDNKDLFPSTEGKEADDYTETGRKPGYNWTSDATVLKNKDYIIAPSILRENIQKKQNSIYADESDSSNDLDYRFYLDRAALNRIRSYSKEAGNGKYTTFTGTFTITNGVSVYNSPLFRSVSGSSYLDNKYIKKTGKLGCNNQANDSACEKYSQVLLGN